MCLFYLLECRKWASERTATSSAPSDCLMYHYYQGNLTKKKKTHYTPSLLVTLSSFFCWSLPPSLSTLLVCTPSPPSNQSLLLSSVKFLTSLHLLLWLNGHGTLLCDLSIIHVSRCMCVGAGSTAWTVWFCICQLKNLTGYQLVFFVCFSMHV